MYNAIIDNGSEDVYKGDMSNFLINNYNIINLMESLPIKQYYLRTKEDIRTKISKEQAYYLYQQLIDYNSQKKH